MKLWEDFLDYVVPSTPGVPTELAVLHIRNAAIDFCARTRVADYRYDTSTIANTATYSTVFEGADYSTAIIDSLKSNGRTLNRWTEDFLNGTLINWESVVGAPMAYFMSDPETIRVYPIPDGIYTLTISVSLRPTRDSIGIEDFIFERYATAIADGAIASLASIEKKPWSAPTTAMMKTAKFESAVKDAQIEANKSFNRASLRVKLRRKY